MNFYAKLRTWVLVLILVNTAVPSSPQVAIFISQNVSTAAATFTPTLVSVESNSSTLGNSTGTTVNRCATGAYCAQHVPALAGNTWIFAVQYADASTTITPTDYICNTSGCSAAGDTCAMIGSPTAAQNSKRLIMGYCKNLTAGATEIKLAFSTNTSGVSATILEFDKIDNTTPLDAACSTNTNAGSTTVQSGSCTPGAANKFLVQFAVRTQTPVSASCGHGVSDTKCFTAGTGQSGATWVIHSSDAIDGIVEQDTVYTSASSITPQLTMAASSGYASVAATFNTANTGNPRGSGMQVVQVMHQNQNTASSPASVIHTQMRTEGNYIGLSAGMGGSTYSITGVTDNDGCTWTHSPKGQLGDAGTGKSDYWYCENSTPNTAKLIDIAVTGTQADYTIHLYDITGAKTSSSLIEEAGFVNPGPGTQPIHTFDFLGSGATDGIVIYNLQENSNTSQGFTSPTGMVSNATLFGGEDISGGSTNPPDENNGWGWLKFTSGNNQLSFVPTFADGTAVGSFAYRVEFIASSTATIGTSAAARTVSNCTHANAALHASNDGGQEWALEPTTNGFKYVSNTCQPFNQTNDQGTIYIGVTFANDQWAQVTLGTTSGGTASGGQGIGVSLRASTSVHTEYRIVHNTAASNQIEIGKMVTGTFTSLKICSANTTPASGDTFYWQISGTSITGKQNGSSITSCGTTTDSAISSGSPGMSFSSSMTSSSITAWKAGNL